MVQMAQMGKFVAEDISGEFFREQQYLPAEADMFSAAAAAPAGPGACNAY